MKMNDRSYCRRIDNENKLLIVIEVKFSKEYFMKRYNLGEGDFELKLLLQLTVNICEA